jgi:hypothetical protein
LFVDRLGAGGRDPRPPLQDVDGAGDDEDRHHQGNGSLAIIMSFI